MKRIIFILMICLGSAGFVFAQDTTRNKSNDTTNAAKSIASQVQEYDTVLIPKKRAKITFKNKKKVYRPTRLGSSSPIYDTYKRNDRGAGAVTTNPNKAKGNAAPVITIPKTGIDSTIINPADSGNMKRADSSQIPSTRESKRKAKDNNSSKRQ